MDLMYLKVALFSIIQALTEFLPVSSSGHLVVLHNIFNDEITNNIAFDVMLHGGSLFAIIIYFWKDLIGIVKSFFYKLFHDKKSLIKDEGSIILVGIIPAGILGYFFNDIVEYIFRKPLSVSIALIFGSLIFILAEKIYKPKKSLKDINFLDAVFVGFMQCLSLIPGISRSGITISSAMIRNVKREDAARFSFLMAIPLIFGAFIKNLFDVFGSGMHFQLLFLAFCLSFVFSILALKILMVLLKKSFGLYIFAFYRIILAIAIIIFLV